MKILGIDGASLGTLIYEGGVRIEVTEQDKTLGVTLGIDSAYGLVASLQRIIKEIEDRR